MENIILDGKLIDLNSFSTEQLNAVFNQLDTKELSIKQEIDTILARLA